MSSQGIFLRNQKKDNGAEVTGTDVDGGKRGQDVVVAGQLVDLIVRTETDESVIQGEVFSVDHPFTLAGGDKEIFIERAF